MDFIQQGRVYRSAEPRLAANGHVNDRVVLRVVVLGDDVIYDSPAVSRKRGRYPRCRRDAFEAWAAEDVTDLLQGTWQRGLDNEAHQRRLVEARNAVPGAGTPMPVVEFDDAVPLEEVGTLDLNGFTLTEAGSMDAADLEGLA